MHSMSKKSELEARAKALRQELEKLDATIAAVESELGEVITDSTDKWAVASDGAVWQTSYNGQKFAFHTREMAEKAQPLLEQLAGAINMASGAPMDSRDREQEVFYLESSCGKLSPRSYGVVGQNGMPYFTHAQLPLAQALCDLVNGINAVRPTSL